MVQIPALTAPEARGGEAPPDLSTPAGVLARLRDLERELAEMQNSIEQVAGDWFVAKRSREQEHAKVFMTAGGTVAERNAAADLATASIGAVEEGAFEGAKGALRAALARASICQSILRAQGREL